MDTDLTVAEQQLNTILSEERKAALDIHQRFVLANETESELPQKPDPDTQEIATAQTSLLEPFRIALYNQVSEYWHWAARTCGILINLLFTYDCGDVGDESKVQMRARLAPEFKRLHDENADAYQYSLVLREEAKRVWDPAAPQFAPSRAMTVELIQIADLLYPDIFGEAGPGFSGGGIDDLPF